MKNYWSLWHNSQERVRQQILLIETGHKIFECLRLALLECKQVCTLSLLPPSAGELTYELLRQLHEGCNCLGLQVFEPSASKSL